MNLGVNIILTTDRNMAYKLCSLGCYVGYVGSIPSIRYVSLPSGSGKTYLCKSSPLLYDQDDYIRDSIGWPDVSHWWEKSDIIAEFKPRFHNAIKEWIIGSKYNNSIMIGSEHELGNSYVLPTNIHNDRIKAKNNSLQPTSINLSGWEKARKVKSIYEALPDWIVMKSPISSHCYIMQWQCEIDKLIEELESSRLWLNQGNETLPDHVMVGNAIRDATLSLVKKDDTIYGGCEKESFYLFEKGYDVTRYPKALYCLSHHPRDLHSNYGLGWNSALTNNYLNAIKICDESRIMTYIKGDLEKILGMLPNRRQKYYAFGPIVDAHYTVFIDSRSHYSECEQPYDPLLLYGWTDSIMSLSIDTLILMFYKCLDYSKDIIGHKTLVALFSSSNYHNRINVCDKWYKYICNYPIAASVNMYDNFFRKMDCITMKFNTDTFNDRCFDDVPNVLALDTIHFLSYVREMYDVILQVPCTRYLWVWKIMISPEFIDCQYQTLNLSQTFFVKPTKSLINRYQATGGSMLISNDDINNVRGQVLEAYGIVQQIGEVNGYITKWPSFLEFKPNKQCFIDGILRIPVCVSGHFCYQILSCLFGYEINMALLSRQIIKHFDMLTNGETIEFKRLKQSNMLMEYGTAKVGVFHTGLELYLGCLTAMKIKQLYIPVADSYIHNKFNYYYNEHIKLSQYIGKTYDICR